MDALESSKRDEEILRLLAREEQEIEAALGYPLEVVMAEAEALLANTQVES